MNPLVLMKSSTSLKTEIIIVCCVVFGLFMLPVLVLASVTNISALGISGNSLYDQPKVATDAYDYGFCTYWAALRRIEIGQPIPNTWGDAHTWDDNAFLDGYLVDNTPTFGAVMETDTGDLGHVAFVEAVDPKTGAWTISEMNVAGWDILDQRVMPASSAKYFNFIHERILTL